MTIQLAVDIVRETLWVSLTVIAPLVLAAILTGLTVSIFQSITSLQEQTLTFVPKLIIVSFVMIAIGSWMVVEVTDFAVEMFQRIEYMAP